MAFDNAMMDDLLREFDEIGVDSWIDDAKAPAAKVGLRLVRHGQGFAGYASQYNLWMNRSISEFENRVMDGSLEIRTSPVLNWNSSCAVLETDASGNRKWDKRKSTGRIDLIVAACMAIGLAAAEGKKRSSASGMIL